MQHVNLVCMRTFWQVHRDKLTYSTAEVTACQQYAFLSRLLSNPQAACAALPVLTLLLSEWNIIYDKLAKCAESGAQIVLSRLAIGDLGTQYFADRGIFCAGRVPEDDLQRMAKATGARV
jgi:hypothetical protein